MFQWKRLLALAAVGGAVAGIGLIPSRPGEGKGASNQVIILSTASVRGEVSPCG